MTILYDANGRDANGNACCPTCSYPFSGAHCPNPACDANPQIPESVKAERRARAAKAAAEEAERERIRQIHRRMYG